MITSENAPIRNSGRSRDPKTNQPAPIPLACVPDPASLELDSVWEEEWQKNLLDAAIERVKQQVTPKQFQIFDLSVLRELPVAEVTTLLKVNAAQVYLARHRVGALIKQEAKRLETQAERTVIMS